MKAALRPAPSEAGFTLAELMVTVAVIGILSSLAVASYVSVMAKGDRATAISDVVEISQALERYYSFNRVYSNDFGDISMASNTSFAASIKDNQGLYNYYIAIPGSITVNNVPQTEKTGLSYKLYAKPTGKNRDKWILSYDELGYKQRYVSGSTTAVDGWP